MIKPRECAVKCYLKFFNLKISSQILFLGINLPWAEVLLSATLMSILCSGLLTAGLR